MDFSKIKVEKLSKIHEVSQFDCNDTDINEFLKEDALKWQDDKLAVTRIFIYGEEIVGFSCISADSIKLKKEEKEEENRMDKKKIREVPAIKIGRLGRSKEYGEKELGKFILTQTIGHIIELSNTTGIRFVTVDAYPNKESWYSAFGFKRNEKYKGRENVSMRFCILNIPKKEEQTKLFDR